MPALGRPPRGFGALHLPTIDIQPDQLVRVSRHASGEPYFGKTAANRFDDPGNPARSRFGTCYFGLDLTVAIAETILHDEMPRRGHFAISSHEVDCRFVVTLQGTALRLANLTGAALKALVGDSSISTITPYELPQAWARAIHRHPAAVDGILYVSQHVNDRKAVVLFDRAAAKFARPKYRSLKSTPGALAALMELRVSFEYG